MWKPDATIIITAEQKAASIRLSKLVPLTPRQLWLAAARIGVSKADVLTAVDGMEDTETAGELRIELTEASAFERDHPSVEDLRALLDIPADQFDDLWIWAAGL